MADINARLLQAIDGSAPQHKVRGQNRFEFSEGSDRTLHVKIAGKNGNPLDFEGDKFPVEDKQLQSVINELNKVKSELESIKNGTLKVKNDQLIDKIDALLAKQQSLEDKINSVMQGNAFRTQLTGSYVKEIVIVKGLEISAGSSAFIGVQNLEDAEYLSFAIRSGKAHNFVATAQRRTSNGLFLDYSPPDRLQLLNVTNKSVALSDRFPVTAPVMMFVVQNNSTETQTYDAYLYKIGSKVM